MFIKQKRRFLIKNYILITLVDLYVNLSYLFLLPNFGSTFPEVDLDLDLDLAKWYGPNRIRIWNIAIHSVIHQSADVHYWSAEKNEKNCQNIAHKKSPSSTLLGFLCQHLRVFFMNGCTFLHFLEPSGCKSYLVFKHSSRAHPTFYDINKSPFTIP